MAIQHSRGVSAFARTDSDGYTALPSGEPTVRRDVPVPMRDGVLLSADVYHPAGQGPHPVLVMRVPYGKEAAQTIVFAHPYWYASHGYIVVVQDTRGRFKSEGEFSPWVDEAADGYDTVEWAAELPGASGAVGMYGFSYAGGLQLQAAALAPPHLRAIAPAFSSLDVYGDWIYPGGALSWAFLASWGAGDLVTESARRLGDPDLEERLHALARELPDSYWHLPVCEHPALPRAAAPYVHDWLAHPWRDEFWSQRTGEQTLSTVSVPGLHIGGWSDVFIAGTLASFSTLANAGAAEQRLVIGPWMHMPWIPWSPPEQGDDQDFGDVNSLQLDWFDRWLKTGSERPASTEQTAGAVGPREDAARVFTMGSNRWTSMRAWPPACELTSWHLHSDGRANSRFGDGALAPQAPAGEPFDVFVYDPRNPVPSVGGRSCCNPEIAPIGFSDQRSVEERNDVLVYSSAALEEPLEIGGDVTLLLWAATSALDTDFTGKLVDVQPDGAAINVVEGIVRARHRRVQEPESLLEPDSVHRFALELGPIRWCFRAGHRIRLEVASSSFPRYSRNANARAHPNTARFGDLQSATQRIYHDRDRPSALILPVLDPRAGT